MILNHFKSIIRQNAISIEKFHRFYRKHIVLSIWIRYQSMGIRQQPQIKPE